MNISTNRVNLETQRDSEGNSAIAVAEYAQGMFGSSGQIRLVNCGPRSGSFWLARWKDAADKSDYILLLPSPRWEQDAKDAGWTLIQKLSTEGHTK